MHAAVCSWIFFCAQDLSLKNVFAPVWVIHKYRSACTVTYICICRFAPTYEVLHTREDVVIYWRMYNYLCALIRKCTYAGLFAWRCVRYTEWVFCKYMRVFWFTSVRAPMCDHGWAIGLTADAVIELCMYPDVYYHAQICAHEWGGANCRCCNWVGEIVGSWGHNLLGGMYRHVYLFMCMHTNAATELGRLLHLGGITSGGVCTSLFIYMYAHLHFICMPARTFLSEYIQPWCRHPHTV